MVDDNTTGKSPGKDTSAAPEVDVVVGGGTTHSGDFSTPPGPGEKDKPKVKSGPTDGFGLDFGNDGSVNQTGLRKTGGNGNEEAGTDAEETDADQEDAASDGATGETGEADDGTGGEEAGNEGDGEDTDAEAGEALPEFDPENEEAVTAWDAKYFPGDGEELDTSGFTAELEANLAKEDGKAELNEDSYKYLNHRLGVSKEAVDQIIKGQLSIKESNESAFYALTPGGKDAYEKRLGWAKGVYTDEQKARFNDALKAGGEAAKEAVELLNTRYATANPNDAQPKAFRKGKPQRSASSGERRPSSPKKAAKSTAGGGSPSGETFADNTEYVAALKGAKGDPVKEKAVREKLARSKFWRT